MFWRYWWVWLALVQVFNLNGQDFLEPRGAALYQRPATDAVETLLRGVPYDSLQTHLGLHQTALIGYILRDSLLDCVVLDGQETRVYTQKIPADWLERVRAYRVVLTNPKLVVKQAPETHRALREYGHWFYQWLLAEPMRGLPHKNLLIIPDKDLHFLPFEAFIADSITRLDSTQAPHLGALPYLVKTHTINYGYSVPLYWAQANTPIQHAKQKLFLVAGSYGHPVHPEPDAEQARLRRALRPLPFAKQEVLGLKQKLNGFALTDGHATEYWFKQWCADFSTIHLAVHGILDENDGQRSCLVFSESADSLEDDFLYPHEIEQLPLNANLVVLSACETGYGRIHHADGVSNLARSFLRAGVPSVITTLWSINDQASAVLMNHFYEGLRQGLNKTQALRQAKLAMIAESDKNPVLGHPMFWAGYVHVGKPDTKELRLSVKPQRWFLFFSVLGSGILFAVWASAQRKKHLRRQAALLRSRQRQREQHEQQHP